MPTGCVTRWNHPHLAHLECARYTAPNLSRMPQIVRHLEFYGLIEFPDERPLDPGQGLDSSRMRRVCMGWRSLTARRFGVRLMCFVLPRGTSSRIARAADKETRVRDVYVSRFSVRCTLGRIEQYWGGASDILTGTGFGAAHLARNS